MTLHKDKSYRSFRQQHKKGSPFQLKMVPMIDVVFLLLVFFLLTANFRSREGFLPAELPRQITHTEHMELEPLMLYLHSRPDGTCRVDIGADVSVVVPAGESNFANLGAKLHQVVLDQGRHLDDPVKLIPNAETQWDHVVKIYHLLWQCQLRNIIFTINSNSKNYKS